MTEFRRAQASVEAIEQLVEDLAKNESPEGFPFCPRPRPDFATVDDDWVVVGTYGATITVDQRTKFAEIETRINELEPVIERMRKRCQIRLDLESAKSSLKNHLENGSYMKAHIDPDDNITEIATTIVEHELEGHAEIHALLIRIRTLETSVTYGIKMVEQVLDLLARLDAARALFNTDVVPRLGSFVAMAAANEEVWRTVEEMQVARAAEEEARRAKAEAWRPVATLLAASEQRRQAEQEAKEMAEWQCAQPLEEALWIPPTACSEGARTMLPRSMWLYS
mmetsp:Transcript_14381/g.23514  ORF Transcript_14381/g.23514 Transcript_14381/m.23514 type:complete len:281 (+) Transcript_14381:60-902(+)